MDEAGRRGLQAAGLSLEDIMKATLLSTHPEEARPVGRSSCLANVTRSTCQDLRILTCCVAIDESQSPALTRSQVVDLELTSSIWWQTNIMWKGHSLTPVTVLTKRGNVNLAKRKQQTHSRWGRFCKITGLNSKNVKVMKDKQRLKDSSRLKDTKGTWRSNVTCDPRPRPGNSYKGHHRSNWQNVNVDCAGWIIVSYRY